MRNLEFVAAVALLTGCAIVTGPPAGPILNDATMTAAVKGRLASVEGLRTLIGGYIPDAATGHRIDVLVRNVAGHHRVKNELMIESEAIVTAER